MAIDTFPFPRTACACAACVACCKQQPGALAPGDFERIAAHLGLAPDAAAVYFWASPGALARNRVTGHTFWIRTITPRLEAGRCVFLDAQDRCRVHAVAPAGCAYFDMHQSAAEGQFRSAVHHRAILDDAAYGRLRGTLPPATSWRPMGERT